MFSSSDTFLSWNLDSDCCALLLGCCGALFFGNLFGYCVALFFTSSGTLFCGFGLVGSDNVNLTNRLLDCGALVGGDCFVGGNTLWRWLLVVVVTSMVTIGRVTLGPGEETQED